MAQYAPCISSHCIRASRSLVPNMSLRKTRREGPLPLPRVQSGPRIPYAGGIFCISFQIRTNKARLALNVRSYCAQFLITGPLSTASIITADPLALAGKPRGETARRISTIPVRRSAGTPLNALRARIPYKENASVSNAATAHNPCNPLK